MVVHYTLQRHRCSGSCGKETEKHCSCAEQTSEPDNDVEIAWWAAQVASNKEYDTKREIMNCCGLDEKDIIIPRKMVYNVKEDKVDKKTEMVLPGYLLLRLGSAKVLKGIESMQSYISILGKVSLEEMGIIKSYENIPKNTEALEGDKIIVTNGPFAGVRGVIIKEIDVNYYKCRLMFQGNEIVANMDERIVEKIA